jgi:hypothetical protein
VTAPPSPGDRAAAISVLKDRLTEGGMTGTVAAALAAELVDQAIKDRAAPDGDGDAGPKALAGGGSHAVDLARWDELLHPRGAHGRFAKGAGGSHGVPWDQSGDTVTYHGNLGIDRADMPQLSGTVHGKYVPSAEMVPKFIKSMQAKGVKVTRGRVPASSLHPTQTTGDMHAIRGIADSVKAGKETKPVIISSDNRVLDGHHNWAARVLAGSEGGGKGAPAGTPVVRVGLPMRDLLKEASDFGAGQGIARRAPGVMANPAYARAAADSLAAHTGPDGKLTPERAALHEKIIAGALAGTSPSKDPTATFMTPEISTRPGSL